RDRQSLRIVWRWWQGAAALRLGRFSRPVHHCGRTRRRHRCRSVAGVTPMPAEASPRKPANIVYALDEAPPPLVTAGNAVQHVALISINFVYPLLIFRLAGVPVSGVASLLAVALLVLGAGTFLQAARLGPIGSGFLCPATFTAAYLSPSLLAVKAGGLSLLFGMTLFAGAMEVLFSRLLTRMRPYFPTEISGLVIVMIGVSAGMAGLRLLFGANVEPVTEAEWSVAGITLASMMAFNVWGRGL